MAEVKTYGFLIGLDECIRRRHELSYDMKKCKKGFIGVTPEPNGLGQILLYDSLDNRNSAMKYFKGLYQTVRKVPVEIYIDDKWMSQKPTPEDFGDEEFSKMIHELEDHALEEAKKDYEEKERIFRNQIGEYKAKISEMNQTINLLDSRVKASERKVIEILKEKDKTIKNLNKEIKELESKIKMLQRALQKGE